MENIEQKLNSENIKTFFGVITNIEGDTAFVTYRGEDDGTEKEIKEEFDSREIKRLGLSIGDNIVIKTDGLSVELLTLEQAT